MYKIKKTRKKKRTGIKILMVLAVVALLLGGVYYMLLTRTVTTVYVEGNVHYTKEEIEKMVMSGPLGNNSLYLSLEYADKEIKDIPFIASMKVEVISPDTIKIRVFEKTLAGYVTYLDKYLYFDNDGIIVEISNIKTEGIPEITGLDFSYAVLGEPLPVTDRDVFARILSMTKTLNKYKLTADKIYFGSADNMVLFFGEIKVKFGSDELLDEKLTELQSILPKLAGQSGTLDLQNYDKNTQSIPFMPKE